jgi:hypothetical protein
LNEVDNGQARQTKVAHIDLALTEIQNERILLSRNPASVQCDAGMKRLDKWEAEILDKQLEDNADAFIATDRSDWSPCCKTSYLIGKADSTIERSLKLEGEIRATKNSFEPPLSKDEEDLLWQKHYEDQANEQF